MVSAPTKTKVTSATSHRHRPVTEKGTVASGDNGLPARVTVNGHRARLIAHKTSDAFTATFARPRTLRSIKITVTDVVGNTRTVRFPAPKH